MKKALAQLHIAVFLAGFTAILGRWITLNEGLLVWYRLFITVLTLGMILFFSRGLEGLKRKDVLPVFGVGAVVAIHWVAFYGSIRYSNVSVALVCFSATAFFTAFFEPLIMKRRLAPVEVVLGLLAMSGICIIFDFHPRYKTGILFGIVSAMGSALFPIFNKRLLVRFSPQTLTFYELGGGLLVLSFLVPLYLIWFPAHYYWPTAKDWICLLVLAWFCTVMAFYLQLKALKKISAFTSNLTYNLEPVYGIIMAFAIFRENEELNRQFYLGLGLIVLALGLQMMRLRYELIVKRKKASGISQ